MTNAPIDGCEVGYQCPKRWDDLDRIASATGIRFCGDCQSEVHWAESADHAVSLGKQGKCVALGFLERVVVGEMSVGSFESFGPVGLPAARAEAGLWGLLIGDAVGVP